MHSMFWDRLQAHPMMQKWNSKKGTPTINEEILVWPFVECVAPNDDLSEFVGPCLFDWACNLFHAELSWFHSKKFGLRLHVSFFLRLGMTGYDIIENLRPKTALSSSLQAAPFTARAGNSLGHGASARKNIWGKICLGSTPPVTTRFIRHRSPRF